MKHLLRKILTAFIVFSCLGVILAPLALIVFNLWVLPSLFQSHVQEDLSKKSGLSLTYDKISYDPVRGIVFQDLSLKKKTKTETFLVQVQSAQIDIAFSSLIKRSLIIKDFRVSEGRFYYTKGEKEPILFSLKSIYGSLHQEQVRTIGLGGWLGNIALEDLSFQKDLSIERARCDISEKEAAIQDGKIFWHGHLIEFEGVVDLLKKKMDAVFKLHDTNFLFAHFESGKLQMGLFAKQTKLLSVTDLDRKFQKSFTQFYGFLSCEDFLPLRKRIGKKISLDSPIKLGGWFVGFDFGEISFKLDSILVTSLFLERVLLKANFYKNQFLVRFLEAKSCKGFLKANGWIDLLSGAYKGSFNFGRLSLNCLSSVLFPKDPKLKGILSGDLTFLGLGDFGENKEIDPVTNIEAEGHLEVRKGDLGKIRIMKGVLKVFKPISSLSQIRLKSGTANYYIRFGDLFIQDLKVMSPTLMMECKGKMGLKKKNLDLDLHASVRPLGLKDKTLLARLLSGGLMIAGDQIWKAKIGGTLKKPVITPLVFPVLQPVKDILRIPFRPFQKKEKDNI